MENCVRGREGDREMKGKFGKTTADDDDGRAFASFEIVTHASDLERASERAACLIYARGAALING